MRSLSDMKRFKREHGSVGALDFLIDYFECKPSSDLRVHLHKDNVTSIQKSSNQLYLDYLKKASGKSERALRSSVLRLGSLDGRELFAARASEGCCLLRDISSLVSKVSSVGEEDKEAIFDDMVTYFDPTAMLELAEVIALQDFSYVDRWLATRIFELFSEYAERRVSRRVGKLFCSFSIQDCNFELLSRIMSGSGRPGKSGRETINIDMLNPFIESPWADLNEWHQKLNETYFTGIEPVEFTASSEFQVSGFEDFDRIACLSKGVVDGPLVTVIVSSYKPDYGIVTAVKSIIDQTYRNLDIIVVDDASGDAYKPVYSLLETLDSRVRVLYQEINQGTYAARNLALKNSKGEFFTCQDSDDWSHPRRVELQVAPLMDDSNMHATISEALQMKPTLVLSDYNRHPVARNASSLTVRRSTFDEVLGAFHYVRKGADTEFAHRLETATATEIKLIEGGPLAVVRRGDGSLSRSEFKPGWRDPARTSYREGWTYWHSLIESNQCSAKLSPDGDDKAFPAPRKFWVNKEEARESVYDVVFVGVWSDFGGPQKSMVCEIEALLEVGCKVAICHMDSLRFMSARHRPVAPEVRKMIHDGVVDEVLLEDYVSVEAVILRYPLVLQFTPRLGSNWSVGMGCIVANQAPHEIDGSDLRYDVSVCSYNCRRMFHKDFVWVPQGPSVRSILKNLVPATLLSKYDNPGILDVAKWWTDRGGGPKSGPIVGRYSRDNLLKFPQKRSDFLKIYSSPHYRKVIIMGGEKSCATIMGDENYPDNWLVLPYGAMPVEDFLRKVDLFIYYDNENIVEAFGRSILEAIASGVVVILPFKFKDVFGDCALYAEPEDVEALVFRLTKNEKYLNEVRSKVKSQLWKMYSYKSFRDLVADKLKILSLPSLEVDGESI